MNTASINEQRSLRTAAALLFIVLCPAAMGAQGGSRDIVDKVDCQRCSIRLEGAFKLVGTDVTSSGPPTAVEVDGSRRIWVAVSDELTKIYDANGRFLQLLGRKGGGPNEYVGPYGLSALPGDSMLVFDSDNGRVLVVDKALVAIRAIRLPGFLYPILPLEWPGSVVLAGMILTPSAAGWPIHMASFGQPDLQVRNSIGYDQGTLRPNSPTDQSQRLAVARSGGFWTADVLRYRISRWSNDGTRVETIVRSPSWFDKPSKDWIGNPQTPPPPRVTGLREDSEGLLWVFVQVAGKNWRQGWPTLTPGVREVSTRSVRYENLFASMIEVVNPKTQRVIARSEISSYAIATLSDGRLALYSRDEDDVPVVTIVRPKLVR